MRDSAIQIFSAAVRAVQPQYLLRKHMRREKEGLRLGEHFFNQQEINKVYIIGAGKASAAMAREAENILGDRIDAGFIVTKYEHAFPLKTIECIEAGHPVPDENSLLAGREIFRLLKNASLFFNESVSMAFIQMPTSHKGILALGFDMSILSYSTLVNSG